MQETMNQTYQLAEEIKKRFGFHYVFSPTFENPFAHETGRITVHSDFVDGRRCGKSFWIQACGTKYILGLMSGLSYHCDDKEDLLKAVYSLITDPLQKGPHYKIPDSFKSDAVREFDEYFLLRQQSDAFVKENNGNGPYISRVVIQDSDFSVPVPSVKEYFTEHHHSFAPDASGWVSFVAEEKRHFFRLSSETLHDESLTLVHVGIETGMSNETLSSPFLKGFPGFLLESGVVDKAAYFSSGCFY